jgi:hypothetical protein
VPQHGFNHFDFLKASAEMVEASRGSRRLGNYSHDFPVLV